MPLWIIKEVSYSGVFGLSIARLRSFYGDFVINFIYLKEIFNVSFIESILRSEDYFLNAVDR